MNTCEIMLRLRKRYEPPAWAFLQEVGNATGYGANRHADAIAMSLWPSRGLDIHGFEVKASRQDWMKELKDPAKAESIMQYCDFWWLVVGDSKIVQPGELPPNWGLIIPNGQSIKVSIEAPRLDAHDVSRPFLAALTRRFAEHEHCLDESIIKDRLEKAKKDWQEQHELSHKLRTREHEELKQSVKEFEEKSGVRISRWDSGRIGEAVQIVLSSQAEGAEIRLRRIRGAAQSVIDLIDSLNDLKTQLVLPER